MLKLKIRSLPGSLALYVFGTVACVGSTLITTTSVSVPIPILIIGTLLFYLVINMLCYPKANTAQLLKLSLISLIIFLAIFSVAYVISGLIKHDAILIKSYITLSASLHYIAASILFGILSSILLFKLENIKASNVSNDNIIKYIEKTSKQNTEKNPEPDIVKRAEITEPKETKPQPETPVIPTNKITSENIIKENVINENITRAEHLKKTEKLEEQFRRNEINNEIIEEKPKEAPIEDLNSLPEINLEEVRSIETTKEIKTSFVYDKNIFDYECNDIPDNVRLANNKAKKTNEGKGTITSIGKLLINNRDMENLIEINELMEQIGCQNEDIDVISKSTGIKIYDKFNKIMVDYTQVKDLTLSNKAGFVIASTINNNRKSETVGAIASSAFIVLKNYLERIGISKFKKVFFETDNDIYSIFAIDESILFFITEKSFEPVNYTLLKDILDKNSISSQDLPTIKNTKGILETIITDKAGMVINSINCENPKKIASLSSAIFENLKIFIINIESVELRKITIFADNTVFTMRKYNDKILGLITTPDSPIKLSEKIIEIEKLIK